eukprot:5504056-Amphidinium_carterae.1
MRLCMCAITVYGVERVVQWQSLCSKNFRVHGTIVACCTLGTTMAQLIMQGLHEELAEIPHTLHRVNVIDDLNFHSTGEVPA